MGVYTMSRLDSKELENMKRLRQEQFKRERVKKPLLTSEFYDDEDDEDTKKSLFSRIFGGNSLVEQVTAIIAIIGFIAGMVSYVYIMRVDIDTNKNDYGELNKQFVLQRDELSKIKKMLGGSDVNDIMEKINKLSERIHAIQGQEGVEKARTESEILIIKKELQVLSALLQDQKMSANAVNKKLDDLYNRVNDK